MSKRSVTITHSDYKAIQERAARLPRPQTVQNKQYQHIYTAGKINGASKQKSSTNEIMKQSKQLPYKRFKIFVKQEEQRKIQDENELKYNEFQKQQMLVVGNQKIWEQHPRVRNFNSRLLMVDTIQEREAQIAMKQQIEAQRKQVDQEFVIEQNEQIKLASEQEQINQSQRRFNRIKNQEYLKNQMQMTKENHFRNIQEDRTLGQLISIKCKQEQEKERIKKFEIQERNLKLKGSLQQQELQKIEYEKLQAKISELEDTKIQDYHDRKLQLIEMRKRRDEIQQRIKSEQEKKQQEEFRIRDLVQERKRQELYEKGCQQKQEANSNQEQLKKNRLDELQTRCKRSVSLSVQLKQEQNSQSVQQEGFFQNFWTRRNSELKQLEQGDKLEAIQRNQEMRRYQQSQMQARRTSLYDKINKTFDEKEAQDRHMENQDKIFEKWAQDQIEDARMSGKNATVLQKTLFKLLRH